MTNKDRVIDTGGPRYTYPFVELKVGESFVVKDMAKWNSVRAAASKYGKALGRKFAVVRDGDRLVVTRKPMRTKNRSRTRKIVRTV